MPYELSDEEFAIIIRPVNWEEEDGTDWDGDCETAIGINNTCTLPSEITVHIMDIATMMSTFLEVAAERPDIYALVKQRRDELMDLYSNDEEEDTVTVYKEGNVYTLDIWSKTKGEA
jgi:hypothetical protein